MNPIESDAPDKLAAIVGAFPPGQLQDVGSFFLVPIANALVIGRARKAAKRQSPGDCDLGPAPSQSEAIGIKANLFFPRMVGILRLSRTGTEQAEGYQ